MMRHKSLRNYYISISATKTDLDNYLKDCINEYESSIEIAKVPEFIKKELGG
jgi:hypothetical protein